MGFIRTQVSGKIEVVWWRELDHRVRQEDPVPVTPSVGEEGSTTVTEENKGVNLKGRKVG